MLVPVVVASKHGATTGMDAVIVGSAVYLGRCLEPASDFARRLKKRDLGIGERTMVRVVHAPEGDLRDWAAVPEWAEQIADGLLAKSGSAGG